jgi:hypothetical protein
VGERVSYNSIDVVLAGAAKREQRAKFAWSQTHRNFFAIVLASANWKCFIVGPYGLSRDYRTLLAPLTSTWNRACFGSDLVDLRQRKAYERLRRFPEGDRRMDALESEAMQKVEKEQKALQQEFGIGDESLPLQARRSHPPRKQRSRPVFFG